MDSSITTVTFGVWDSYGLSQYKFRSASFNEDASGSWVNVVVEVNVSDAQGSDRIGIVLA